MLRSLRNSLQTQPKASRSGAEGSKGLGGQEGHTLLFLQCCLVPLFHFLGFLPFCLSFSFLGPCHFLPIAGFVIYYVSCWACDLYIHRQKKKKNIK